MIVIVIVIVTAGGLYGARTQELLSLHFRFFSNTMSSPRNWVWANQPVHPFRITRFLARHCDSRQSPTDIGIEQDFFDFLLGLEFSSQKVISDLSVRGHLWTTQAQKFKELLPITLPKLEGRTAMFSICQALI